MPSFTTVPRQGGERDNSGLCDLVTTRARPGKPTRTARACGGSARHRANRKPYHKTRQRAQVQSKVKAWARTQHGMGFRVLGANIRA